MTHARGADLNLLTALAVLLEERHVSRAADQFHLSQSAMSRTLQRLRETFDDELLVRTRNGYELTPRARKIQHELAMILPRVEALLQGDVFDPATANHTLNIACTDYATTALGPSLFPRLSRDAPLMTMNVMPWHDRVAEDLELGRLDLVLTGVEPDEPLRREVMFEEDFVCLVDREHPVGQQVDLAEYVTLRHVVVSIHMGRQTLIEDRLRELGTHRQSTLRVPYFSAAIHAVPGTNLIATVPRRIARLYAGNPALRHVDVPAEFNPFSYFMAWHPRVDGDLAHRWLRGTISAVARELPVE
jgi:DNA-binding transcriptional LysR family regulator